jgi:hypothetical protein
MGVQHLCIRVPNHKAGKSAPVLDLKILLTSYGTDDIAN